MIFNKLFGQIEWNWSIHPSLYGHRALLELKSSMKFAEIIKEIALTTKREAAFKSV